MAEYGVDIAVRVKRDQVDQLGRLLNAVEKQVGKLNRVKVNLDTSPANRSLDALNNRLREAEQIANRFGGSNKIRQGLGAFSNSVGKLSGELAAVRTAFDQASNAADRQERALELLSGQFKKTRLEGQAFANASKDFFGPALGTLSQRIKEIEKLPRNLFSSGEAIKELTYLQSLAVQGTEEWLTVSKALGRQLEINANIRLGAQRAQGPIPADPFGTKQLMLPAAGQTSGTFAIVDRQAKTEAAINETLTRRQRIQQKVNDLAELEAEQSERLNRSQRATLNTKTKTYQQDRKAASDRRRDIASNVLIGGAFPLLFGQGAGAALGGAVGGGIGARFGGQGGFAGSLVGTFTGQATIDFAIKSAVQLGQALRKPTENIQQLTQFLGIAGTEFESNITTLQKLGMESSASAVALSKLEEILSAEGYKNIDALSKDLTELENAFGRLKLAAANILSEPLTKFLDWLTDTMRLMSKAGGVGGFITTSPQQLQALDRQIKQERSAAQGIAADPNSPAALKAQKLKTEEQNRQLNLARAQFQLENDRLSLTRAELASRQGNLDIQKVQNQLIKLNIEYQNKKNTAKGEELALDIRLLEQQKRQLEAARQNAILLAEREVRKENRSLIAATFQQQVQYNDLLAEAAGLTEGDLANYNKQLENLDGRAKAITAINTLQRENALEGVNELHIRERINQQYDWTLTNELEKIKNQKESLKQQIAAYNLGQLQITQQRELANLQTQTQMGLELAGLQAGTDPRFFGVFGGSRQTQERMGLEMQARMGLMRTELAGVQAQAAVPGLGPEERKRLQQQSQALEDQIGIYERYQPAIIDAAVAQQRFNEAMALTTPVVDSVFESITAVAEGTKTAQQAFADFLMGIANMLMDTVKQMIAQYIALGIARQFAGIPTGSSSNGMFGAGAPTETFAGGGIFSGAGPFQFRANGGSVSSGQPYIVGERGPELFVPGAQGNIVPNNAMGGANIVVNVDAKGTQAQGDQPNAAALGRAIGAAVQAELIKQKRPGGLLA